jgi:hypothetical protein
MVNIKLHGGTTQKTAVLTDVGLSTELHRVTNYKTTVLTISDVTKENYLDKLYMHFNLELIHFQYRVTYIREVNKIMGTLRN